MAAQSEVGLRQVREDELGALKERLARHLPHSYAVHSVVSLAARYGLHGLQSPSILVPACPRPSSFTVITSMPLTVQGIVVFWSVEEHSAKDVARFLSLIPDLDWSQPVVILTLPTILLPTLQSVGSVGDHRVRLQTKWPSHLYNLQVPVLLDAELPSVYHVTRLKEGDVSKIWTHWDLNQLYSEDNIRHDIVHFPSVGIRERGSQQDEAQETLVAWTRTIRIGWMGNTFTMPQHRGRGLASVATVTLARQLLQEGLLAYADIEDANAVSIKFHERLGFKRQCAIVMAVLLPAEAAGADPLG